MMMRCSRNWIKYTMFNFQQIIWISYLWITYEGHSHTQLPFLSAWKLFGQCVFLISQRNIFHRLIYLIKYTTVITSTALYWIAMHFNAVISFVLRRHFVKYYRFVVSVTHLGIKCCSGHSFDHSNETQMFFHGQVIKQNILLWAYPGHPPDLRHVVTVSYVLQTLKIYSSLLNWIVNGV